MSVARAVKNLKTFSDFLELDPAILYCLVALPDGIIATLTSDTLLTDPRTVKQIPMKDMSVRELDRALEGRKDQVKPETDSEEITFRDATRVRVKRGPSIIGSHTISHPPQKRA